MNIPLLCAAALALAFYCAGCAAALRPRADTLDWIAVCDRPAAALCGGAFPLTRADVPAMAAVVLAAGLFWTGGRLRPLALYLSMPPVRLICALLENAAAPMSAAACVFALMKRLFGQTGSAALAALVMSVDLMADPLALVFSAAGFFFLVRFLTAPVGARFLETLPELFGCFASLAVGAYFDPALLLLLLCALLACIAGCAARVSRTGALRWIPLGPLAAILTVLTVCAGVYIPAGLARGMVFPALLWRRDYYGLILQRLAGGFLALYGGWGRVNLARLNYDWFLLLSAVPALAASLVWLVRWRDRRGALIVFWAAAQSVALALLGSHAVALSCAVCTGAVWSRLEANRRLWLAALGAVGLICVMLTQYLARILPPL